MPFTPVTITHDFDLPDQAGALGMVEFTPVEPLRNGEGSVAAAPVRKALDADGSLSMTVKATTDPGTGPPGVPYRIVVRITGEPTRTYYAPVRHDQGSSLDLATVLAFAGGGLGGGIIANPVDLVADAGVITPDATKGYGPHLYTATSDVELDPPVGGRNGQPLEVQVTASGGDRVLSFGGAAGPVTVTDGTTWWGRLSYREADDEWLLDDNLGGTVAAPATVSISSVSGLQAALDAKADEVTTSVSRTASYTVVAADFTVEQVYNSTSAGTFTLPTSSTVGAAVPLRQSNTGQLTIAAASGATLQSRGSAFKLAGQHSVAEARVIAANTWLLYGDITT